MRHVPSTNAPAATLHAWQSFALPPHAVSQQRPSLQNPVAQSVFALHAFARATRHLPPVQVAGAMQSASPVQLTGQPPPTPSHRYTPQARFTGVVCSATGVQVPRLPGASQRSHPPPHAALQQKPSTQKPLVQSPATLHGAPSPVLSVYTSEVLRT